MQKIINRKIYDTDNAEMIHQWDNGRFGNDFHAVTETLYKTTHGSLFLHGKGGAASEYSVQAGSNGRAGGEDIRAMSKDDAADWLEAKNGDKDAFEAANITITNA